MLIFCGVVSCLIAVAEEPDAPVSADAWTGAPENGPASPQPEMTSEPLPQPGAEEPPEILDAQPAGDREPVLSVGEQASPDAGSLPEPDHLGLRLRLDAVRLDQLYEAVSSDLPRDVYRISLSRAIRIALENNKDIQIAEYGPMKADADIFAAWGTFDPVASSNVNYLVTEQSTSSETVTFGGFPSIEIWRTSGQSSVGGLLPWGTQYQLSLDMSKEETTYNSFIEEWSGSLTLSVTQPLLRGFGTDANMARIWLAKNSRLQSVEQLRLQVLNSVAEVIRAYWDLVGAYESLKVREDALANAERFLETNERRLEIGTGAALEVVRAKAGVATRQSELISARSQVLDASDRLKNLMGLTVGPALSPVRLVPVTRPDISEADIDEDKSIARALEYRPEVHTAALSIDSAEIERERAADDMLPQLDVSGSVSQGGRGHYMSDVFDGVRERTDNSYNVGFNGSIPITNRTARGAYQRAKLDKREAEHRLYKAQQEVTLGVRSALRQVATNRILVESNRQSRALQETNLEAEEKRLNFGATTTFELLRVQEDLTAAQVQEVQAIIAYEKALVDLRLAEGILLRELGVEYEAPEADKPVSFVRSILPIGYQD
jgi:outer membrane protein TolC